MCKRQLIEISEFYKGEGENDWGPQTQETTEQQSSTNPTESGLS